MQAVLACIVQRSANTRRVTGDAAHMQQHAPSAAGRRRRLPLVLLGKPVPQCQLAQANRVRQADIDRSVRPRRRVRAVPAGTVRVGRRDGRFPERRPRRLEDARTGADDVDGGESGGCAGPERAELRPRRNICLVEDGRRFLTITSGGVGILPEQLLGAGLQAYVADSHGAATLEEEAREGKVDAGPSAGDQGMLARDGEGHLQCAAGCSSFPFF